MRKGSPASKLVYENETREMEDINKIWDEVLNILKDKISEAAFTPWILPLVPHDYNQSQYTVLCGQSLAMQIIQKSHHSEITKALAQVLGKEVEFKMIYDEELSKKLKKKSQKAKRDELISNIENKLQPSKYDGLKQMQSSYNLNLKYKFENFVVGDNNKFAYGASMAVAKEPGKKYNPLFIYGGSGLGKTHLMQAIGHYVLYNNPDLRVKYIKTEEFVNDLINSIFRGAEKSPNKMNKFREKYRNVDVLLIDDIQFIEGKTRTEVEVFNTFETLHNAGKQIVFTSDRPPENIPTLSDRLRSRFQCGLIADIQVADVETRMAILTKLSQDNNIPLSLDVVEFLATVYKNNIRELEGAFNRVSAYSSINEISITIENVKKIINYSETKKNITIMGIIDVVAEFYNVSADEIKGANRAQKIANARQVAIYLSREIVQESFPVIGEAFSKKHTTIIYSYEKVKEELSVNTTLSDEIKNLVNIINQ